MQIKDLAKATNTKPQVIRFYARAGLITSTARQCNGYRHFSPHTVQKIRFIRATQTIGLKLSVIQDLLARQTPGPGCCGVTSTHLRQRLDEITQTIEKLTVLKDHLARLSSKWVPSGCSEKGIEKCPKLLEDWALRHENPPHEPAAIVRGPQRRVISPSAERHCLLE